MARVKGAVSSTAKHWRKKHEGKKTENRERMFRHQTCMITILHDEQKVQFTQASNLPDHHIFKRYRVRSKRIKNCEFFIRNQT